ncbi:uncharacterized protein LOC129912157 [Episyrphus balteatus]|uniref:uncharacterized protein LOC129912157 n=1 Tax=Episyrphus balteatus TaxID=286459 RepID=UPI0024854510|nr:uncharacterized protein LOC129912157 [Episyrphus balteatus]
MLVFQRIIFFIYLLIVKSSSSQYSYLTDLIHRAYNENDSPTITFVNLNEDFLSIFLQENSEIPVLILNNLEVEYEKFPNVILVVQVLKDESIQNDKVLEKIIPKLRVRKCVIVFESNSNSTNLEQSFSFLVSNNFRRILGIADNISYAYFPYADNKMQTLSKDGPLPQPLNDLNGFTFRTTCTRDIPRLSPFLGIRKEKREIGGFLGKLFLSFIHKHNATFREVLNHKNTSMGIDEIIIATRENRLDLSMNAYRPQSTRGWSYPAKVITCVLMVPVNGYVNPEEYFVRPFSFGVWICVGLFLIYVTVMKVLLNKCRQKNPEYWYSFSEAYSAILMLGPEKTVTSNYSFHIQVFVFTFLIGSIYVIYFTSFMTAFIRIKQYDTIEDLIDNKVPIMVPQFDFQVILNNSHYPKKFLDLFVPVTLAVYNQQIHTLLNINFTFIVGEDRMKFFNTIERTLKDNPLFRKAKESLNFYFLSYILPPNSVFEEILNDCIMRVQDAGLIQKWDSDLTFNAMIHVKLYWKDYDFNKGMEHVALNVGHFKFAWTGLAVGLILATLVFLWEYFEKKKK